MAALDWVQSFELRKLTSAADPYATYAATSRRRKAVDRTHLEPRGLKAVASTQQRCHAVFEAPHAAQGDGLS